jgi:hypothetical protein
MRGIADARPPTRNAILADPQTARPTKKARGVSPGPSRVRRADRASARGTPQGYDTTVVAVRGRLVAARPMRTPARVAQPRGLTLQEQVADPRSRGR